MPYTHQILQACFIVYSTIDNTAHSIPLNSLEHGICTTPMTNIRPDRDLNPVPLNFEPQTGRISHRGRRRALRHGGQVTRCSRFKDTRNYPE